MKATPRRTFQQMEDSKETPKNQECPSDSDSVSSAIEESNLILLKEFKFILICKLVCFII